MNAPTPVTTQPPSRIKMHAPDAEQAEQQLHAARAEFLQYVTLVVMINGDLQALAPTAVTPADGSDKPPPDEDYCFWAAKQLGLSSDQVRWLDARGRGSGGRVERVPNTLIITPATRAQPASPPLSPLPRPPPTASARVQAHRHVGGEAHPRLPIAGPAPGRARALRPLGHGAAHGDHVRAGNGDGGGARQLPAVRPAAVLLDRQRPPVRAVHGGLLPLAALAEPHQDGDRQGQGGARGGGGAAEARRGQGPRQAGKQQQIATADATAPHLCATKPPRGLRPSGSQHCALIFARCAYES